MGGKFFWVFALFSSCSQFVPQVLNMFPKMFPLALHFLSHIVWPRFDFHIYYLQTKQ
jgi:hypothetical protein